MRCAIYARYSSDNQKETSIEDQIRECKAYIEKQGWTLAEDQVYTDYALSGSDLSRPGYNAMKKAAGRQSFDTVVVDDLSRLGRDAGESIGVYKEFQSYGVLIAAIADGIDTSRPSGKFPLYFKGIMNEMFLDDMKAKVVRGLKGQVLRGYSAGGRVYGYKTEPILDPSGENDKFGRPKRLGCKILVDQDQAEIVLRIFNLRASDLGYRSIAHLLNADGIPGPRADTPSGNKDWSPGTIRTILCNPKYIGTWEYNKSKWLNKRIQGLRRSTNNNPSEIVKFQSEELRIVSDALFNAVNSMRRKHNIVNRYGRGKYLMSGLLRCDNCGGGMVVQNARGYSGYVCRTARNKGPAVCDCSHRISRPELESAFVDELRRVLLTPQMSKSIIQKVNAKIRHALSGNKTAIPELRQQQSLLRKQLDNLLKMVEGGDTSESIRNRIKDRESQLKELGARINAQQRLTPNIQKVATEKIQDMILGLNRLLKSRSDNIVLLRNALNNLFPDKITITQTETKDGIEFNVRGDANPFEFLGIGVLNIGVPKGI